jgi:hypothetical protein
MNVFLYYRERHYGIKANDDKIASCHKIKIIFAVNALEAGVFVGFDPVAGRLCFLLLRPLELIAVESAFPLLHQ